MHPQTLVFHNRCAAAVYGTKTIVNEYYSGPNLRNFPTPCIKSYSALAHGGADRFLKRK
ncbi:hypothetical protein GcC1_180035 [Golovinomyces cichoracearum]|uniref:Uncharacterized protein n=1 Tax=Golovinomyces cichoracearum TaxID=62708 RepID=A0A420HN33_9PEZI|nr:hypothetical protein GcC1_180035 [Golovinomyces cichoracearum]